MNDQQIIEDLNMVVRVMRSARMLPDSGELTRDQIDGVRRDFRAYLSNQGLFHSDAAKGTGVSASTISQWLSNSYMGDVPGVTRKVNRWLEKHARAQQSKLKIDYVPTRVAEGLRTLAHMACQHGSMARAVMPSGTGKTMALLALTDELLGHYIYCHELLTLRSFLAEVARTIGALTRGTMADLMRNITRGLAQSGRPIFLDEAHRLPHNVFPALRTIHDLTGCSIIMAGTVEIIERMDDTANARGQIASRTLCYNALDRYLDVESPERGGGEALFTKEEIRKVYARSQIRLDREAAEFIWALACLPGQGCLRLTHKLIQLVLTTWPDEPVTREKLIKALPMHFGERATYIERLAKRYISAIRKRAA